MARGLSSKEIYNRTYHSLNSLGRKIVAAGGTAHYKDYELKGTLNGKDFVVGWSWGNMSNGESVGQCYVYVDGVKLRDWCTWDELVERIAKGV
jgi:hypothetical protein